MLNVPLLRKVMEHIQAHPDEHDQKVWIRKDPACGTAGCFAGWTVLLDGYEPDWERSAAVLPTSGHHQALFVKPRTLAEHELPYTAAGSTSISDAAARVLGLTEGQRYELFDEDLTIADLRERVDGIIAEVESEATDGASDFP